MITVSFNGKLRFKLLLSLDCQMLSKAVMKIHQSGKWIEGKQIKNIIFVQVKLLM
jgi:hypothetical protein